MVKMNSGYRVGIDPPTLQLGDPFGDPLIDPALVFARATHMSSRRLISVPGTHVPAPGRHGA